MSEVQTIDWKGKSGNSYRYWIHRIGTAFRDSPGNYIYAKEVQPGRWSPLYIGQTKRLETRLASHEKEQEARRSGATHIHAHSSGAEAERTAEELDLCRAWKPSCNEMLV